MKKMILVTMVMMVSMVSISAFADEVYDVDGAAVDCASEMTKSVSGSSVEADKDSDSVEIEG